MLVYSWLHALPKLEKLRISLEKSKTDNERFFRAIQFNHVGLVKWYMENKGFTPSTLSEVGALALNMACGHHSTSDVALFFLQCDQVDPNQVDYTSPLHRAICNICLSIATECEENLQKSLLLFKVLLLKGANLNTKDHLGKMPLDWVEIEFNWPQDEPKKEKAKRVIEDARQSVYLKEFNFDIQINDAPVSPEDIKKIERPIQFQKSRRFNSRKSSIFCSPDIESGRRESQLMEELQKEEGPPENLFF